LRNTRGAHATRTKEEEMKLKRYWFRDWRDEKEYVTNAYNIKHLKEKVGTQRIQVLQTYYYKNLKEDSLIVLY